MNSIWNNNLQAFNNRFPQLSQNLNQAINFVNQNCDNPEKFLDFWQIFPAKNNEITATENGLRLHSSYNPSREAESSLSSIINQKKSNIIFYGFGLGYHLFQTAKLIAKENLQTKIILIEPDVMHFLGSLLLLDWTEVFTIPNLVLAINCPCEFIISLIEDSNKINLGNTGVSDSFFVDIPSFQNHNQPYFDSVKEIIKRNIEKNKINQATLDKFGKLWIRNSLRNLSKLNELESIENLRNSAVYDNSKNPLPFLIIGAGPSLEYIIPYLKEIKKRCVIVCVETALHTLLKANVQPDFILLMDPQYWAYKHIAGLKADQSILITEISAYPAVFRFDCKKIMLASSQFPVGQYFEKKLNYFPGDLGTGGSVASSAWNFAYFCGAKEIYFAGLDLGFPGKQTHIKGSSAEQTFHKIANRITTAEKSGISSLFSANAKPGINYENQPMVTDSRMELFAWWFESRIANCPEVKTFTLCKESLKIPGVLVKEVKDLISANPNISEVKEKILSLKKHSSINKEAFEKLKKGFPDKEFQEAYGFLNKYWPTKLY